MNYSELIQTDSPNPVSNVLRLSHCNIIMDKASYCADKQMNEKIKQFKREYQEPQLYDILSSPVHVVAGCLASRKKQKVFHSPTTEIGQLSLDFRKHKKDLFTWKDTQSTSKSFKAIIPSPPRDIKAFLRLPKKLFDTPPTSTQKRLALLNSPVDKNETDCFSRSCFNFFPEKREWKYSDYGPLRLPFRLGTVKEFNNCLSLQSSTVYSNDAKVIQSSPRSTMLSQICKDAIMKRRKKLSNRQAILEKPELIKSTYNNALSKMNTFMKAHYDRLINCVSNAHSRRSSANSGSVTSRKDTRNIKEMDFYKLVY